MDERLELHKPSALLFLKLYHFFLSPILNSETLKYFPQTDINSIGSNQNVCDTLAQIIAIPSLSVH